MNTHNGVCAFEVTLTDGRVFVETDGQEPITWDDIPTDVPVLKVSLRHRHYDIEYVNLTNFKKYFFSNVGVARRQGGHVSSGEHVGKILGGVRADGSAIRISVGFPLQKNVPDFQQHDLTNIDDCGYAPHMFREAHLPSSTLDRSSTSKLSSLGRPRMCAFPISLQAVKQCLIQKVGRFFVRDVPRELIDPDALIGNTAPVSLWQRLKEWRLDGLDVFCASK